MSPLDALIVQALNDGRLRAKQNGDRLVLQAGFGSAWSTVSELHIEQMKPKKSELVVS